MHQSMLELLLLVFHQQSRVFNRRGMCQCECSRFLVYMHQVVFTCGAVPH